MSNDQEMFDPNIPIATLLSVLEVEMQNHDHGDGCLDRMLLVAELQSHYGEGPLPQPPITR
jgi:hypothetical protein